MKLRTFDGEQVRGDITRDFSVSQNGLPILLVNGNPFPPGKVEFFLESATLKELEMLEESGYDFPEWEGKEGYVVVEEVESNHD